MANLTKDRKSQRRDGEVYGLPVAAAAHIFTGALTNINASGYVERASDTAGHRFNGVSRQETDNTSGANGALINEGFSEGVFNFNASGIAAADAGEKAFIVDDNTVGLGITQPVNVTGVKVRRLDIALPGVKALAFTAAGTTLAFGGGAAVNVGAGGRFILTATDGSQVEVTVTAASLPGANQSDNLTVRAVHCGRIVEYVADGTVFVDIEKLN